MNHDPMCPMAGWVGHDHEYAGDVMRCQMCADYTDERCACVLIARVREDEKWKADLAITLWEQHANGAYNRALRDAVEAVKLSCSADIELVERSEVIAAIEALGGER